MAARAWCFTVNKTEELNKWEEYEHTQPVWPNLRYIVWQVEKASKEHVQGYAEFSKPTRMGSIKKYCDCPAIHLETRKGTRDQARDYCLKEDTRSRGPFEWGEWTSGGQGKRNDLSELAGMIKEGKSILELAEVNPSGTLRNLRSLREYKFLCDQEKCKSQFRDITVVLITGDTGVGKTHLIFEYCLREDISLYKLDEGTNNAIWFDGYESQKAVLLDDYYGWLKYGNFLKFLDRYPFRLPVKGSHGWAAWEYVFITSNKAPQDWYKKGCPPALERRFSVWYQMDGNRELHKQQFGQNLDFVFEDE